jgi:hypothetical protein
MWILVASAALLILVVARLTSTWSSAVVFDRDIAAQTVGQQTLKPPTGKPLPSESNSPQARVTQIPQQAVKGMALADAGQARRLQARAGEKLSALVSKTPCPSSPPDPMGIRYAPVPLGIEPIISKEQALEIAGTWKQLEINPDIVVNAQYVLYTDDDQTRRGKKLYVNVPAWVITFCGVNLLSSIGGAVNHEENVAINAQTGNGMGIYSYK